MIRRFLIPLRFIRNDSCWRWIKEEEMAVRTKGLFTFLRILRTAISSSILKKNCHSERSEESPIFLFEVIVFFCNIDN